MLDDADRREFGNSAGGAHRPIAQRAFSTTYDSDRQGEAARGRHQDRLGESAAPFSSSTSADAGGTVANWAVEFGNPLDLESAGWKPGSLHIGDVVTVEGIPARGEARQAFAKSVVLTRTGKRLFVASSKPRASAAAAPAPRWPDGQVRLGPPPGKKGYWGAASVERPGGEYRRPRSR